ncbi:hypothetical protein BvCmsNSNP012_03600 [Escherichia coli]|nr:hypothetical protein BvCmsNSNP012_03600 [Escherichia coli]
MTLAERLKQTGREEGIALGLAQGIERGMAQGIERGMAQGIERGMAQGIERGNLEGRLETARNMLNAGMDRQTVLQMTGLSDEQLAMLKH